jgi:hypothetical protein
MRAHLGGGAHQHDVIVIVPVVIGFLEAASAGEVLRYLQLGPETPHVEGVCHLPSCRNFAELNIT